MPWTIYAKCIPCQTGERCLRKNQVNGLPWRLLSVATSAEPDLSVPLSGLLKMAEECGASLVVLPIGSKQVWVGLPDRYRHWTRTQAVLLAHELLGGPLGNV